MKPITYFLFFVCCIFVYKPINAQNEKCGTDEVMRKLWQENPNLYQEHLRFLENNKTYITDHAGNLRTVYTIPIVFHILHEYGTENITDAQVIDQVNILNRDFMKLNADTANVINPYKPLIGNANIQFKLAAIDPDGNCTNGINRIFTHETKIGDDNSKLVSWDRSKYLNVWVVKNMANGVAGYAYYPSAVTSGVMIFVDGIIIRHNYIGSIGTSSPTNSRALTHEIGHYLGLAHTWGNTNNPVVACGDDGIQDTPVTRGHNNCSNRVSIFCDNNNFSNAIYNFNDVTQSSGQTDPTGPPDQVISTVTRITLSNFTANGVSANSQKDSVFAFNNWDGGANDGETVYTNLTGTINTAKYYEFTVSPQTLQGMTLTAINFNAGRNNTGARTFAVRSSADNFTNNLNATIVPANPELSVQTGNIFFINNDLDTLLAGARIVLSGTNFTNVFNPITFRIYAYNAEDNTGTFEIDNLSISGTFGTIENVENYMEYAYCSKMFTIDQCLFMDATLNNTTADRNNLWSAANLTATGTDLTTPPLCAPVSDFHYNRKYVCLGDNVIFTARPWRATVDTYQWTFTGANISTSNLQNPTVTFNTHGWQSVTLTVTNASGSDTKTIQKAVYVSPVWGDYSGPHSETFDGPNAHWWLDYIENPEDNPTKWQMVNTGGYNNSKCLLLNNHYTPPFPYNFLPYNNTLGGNVDAFISPSYNLNNSTAINLSFKYSAATRATNTNDMTEELKVYSSVDCGKTWQLRKTLNKAALNVGGYTGNYYIPLNNSYWATENINIGTLSPGGRVRFKFEYTSSDFSNNVYIDDINVTAIVGIDDLTNNPFSLNIFPNPAGAAEGFTLSFETLKTQDIVMLITDISGKTIYRDVYKNVSGQTQKFIHTNNIYLSEGVYFISLNNGEFSQTKKLVIYK